MSDEPTWIDVQHRTFTTWLNSQLAKAEITANVDNLVTGLADGTLLIKLLEIISEESLGRYNRAPKLRVQKAENVNIALDFVRSKNIALTNIGAEDVIDGNLKLICGLLWMLILRFTISDINVDGLTAKEGLLLWCQRKTSGYTGVDIRNFTTSWTDGLAFCSLLHRYRPDLLEFKELKAKNGPANIALAFTLAEKHIGIHKLLRVEDVCASSPDERSVMTYVAQYFHAFSHLDKVEAAGRRVTIFSETVQSAWTLQHDYEQRMKALFEAMDTINDQWRTACFDGTYKNAKSQSQDLNKYKATQKRAWTREKLLLESLFGTIETKLRTYQMKSFVPPPGMRIADLGDRWEHLLAAEGERSRAINKQIRQVKEDLRLQYAAKANDFAAMLKTLSNHLSTMSGELEQQLADTAYLVEHIDPLRETLQNLLVSAKECEAANVEENDHTIYAYEDMEYEFKLAHEAITKRYQFIENQIVARAKTNITPAHLEEIDNVFRHFDKSGANSLQENELVAALASLGLTFDDAEMDSIVSEIGDSAGRTNWEAFLNFMIKELEDQRTPEQVLLAFREVADAKAYVTELDLRSSLLPETTVEFLVKSMPLVSLEELEAEDHGQNGMDYMRFMEKLLFDGRDSQTSNRS